MIKISIITINYNNLAGLQTTFNSVAAQTYQEFEYIIIDGGSTDGSVAYIESQAQRLAYWVSELDKGVYHAMNKGIAKASGEYVLFLNSGDHFYDKNSLKDSVQELKDQDIVYGNLQVVENDKAVIKEYPIQLSFSYFVKDTLPHPATFIKRDAFAKTALYKEDFKILSDWKFFIDAICKYNLTYKKINIVVSTFYIGGMSSNPSNRSLKFQEREQVLQQDYPAYVIDLEDVLVNKDLLETLRKSRIIQLLIKWKFLNKF